LYFPETTLDAKDKEVEVQAASKCSPLPTNFFRSPTAEFEACVLDVVSVNDFGKLTAAN